MTDRRNGAGGPDPLERTGHLDDQYLSAHLDDADDAVLRQTVIEHLEACGRCRRRLATLDRAREVVRQPVAAVAPEIRSEVVAAALRMAEAPPSAHAPATVPPSADRPEAAGSSDALPRPVPQRLPLRRRTPVLVGAAAAVLAVVAGLSAGLAFLGSHPGSTSAGSAAGASRSAASSSASGGSSASSVSSGSTARRKSPNQLPQPGVSSDHVGSIPAATPNVLGPNLAGAAGLGTGDVIVLDLGHTSSVVTLRSALDNQLEGLASSLASKSSAALPYPSGSAVTNGPAGSSSTSASSATSQFNALGPSSIVTLGRATAFAHCLPAARRIARSGSPEVVATTTYRGTAALTYWFGSPTGSRSSQARLVVVTRGTCHELASASW
jgi:hypothetical protein